MLLPSPPFFNVNVSSPILSRSPNFQISSNHIIYLKFLISEFICVIKVSSLLNNCSIISLTVFKYCKQSPLILVSSTIGLSGGAVMTAMFLSLMSGSDADKVVDIETAVYTFGAPSVCMEKRPSLPEDHVHHVCYQLDLVVCYLWFLSFSRNGS